MDNKNIYDIESLENKKYKKIKKKRKGMLSKAIMITLGVSILGAASGSVATYIALEANRRSSEENRLTVTEINHQQGNEVLTISEAYDKVSPAVVTVSAKGLQQYNGIFMQETEGIGSGFIISEEGHVLTNYHVIEGAKEVVLILSDGEEVSANILNYDEDQDIAMLQIIDDIEIPAVAELGDSELLIPGEEVIAIGTPLSTDLSQTVTNGIISALNRNVVTDDGITLNVIQTNTAINPGNSGGPLVNTRGQVIGINTLKIIDDSTEGIGFSIPINNIKGQIESLSKPVLTLGISIRIVDEKTAEQINLEEGLYILEVTENSPAQLSGLKAGDLIIEADGDRVKTFEEFDEVRDTKEEGDTIELKVIREGKVIDIDVILTSN